MEGGGVGIRWVLMVGLVLGMVIGESNAFSPICYAGCVGECLIFHGSLVTCAVKCLWKCLLAVSEASLDSQTLCKFDCAVQFCSNITTVDYLGADEVASCVNSCEGNCKLNYLSS